MTIVVVGAGAWGTALALNWARARKKVTLIARREDIVQQLTQGHHPKLGLIGTLPSLCPTTDLKTLETASIIVLATPAQAIFQTCKTIKPHLAQDSPVIITAKGIDLKSHSLLSDGISDILGNHSILCLSGPSFAADMANNQPTAVTLAAQDITTAQKLSEDLSTSQLRLYASDDLTGVQLGGALKNVLAIAAGIVSGFGLGESAKAALITRAFVEMQRYANFFGAKHETLYGLSGLGDLILTSNSPKSRNYAFGNAIGEAACNHEKSPNPQGTVEGYYTVSAVYNMAQKHDISMPIVEAVHDIIYNNQSVEMVISSLMSRPMTSE